MRVLKPGGRLSFVVTNKWLKAAYGEPLHRFFAEHAWVESVIDFGHAKQIFPDADVFPSIIVARKPSDGLAPATARACVIPREQLRVNDLEAQIDAEGFDMERAEFSGDAWELEPKSVVELLSKIRAKGSSLTEFAGARPYRGVVTGFNEAFLIATAAKDALISEDHRSVDIIKPYLRGQDIKRWSPEWNGVWMIFARRGIDIEAYPAIKRHLSAYRERLVPKPKEWQGANWPGRKPGAYQWYEIQDTVDYWRLFDQPKILYQDITWRPSFCYDTQGTFSNDTTFFIPTSNLWVLACLNSPVSWWYAWRTVYHGKDEALRLKGIFMNDFPIPAPTPDQAAKANASTMRLIELAKGQQKTVRDLLDWLKVEYEIADPSMKLQSPIELECDALVAEVKKLRGKKKALSLAALRSLRDEHGRTIVPAQVIAREALGLERQISDLVNAAYGLTPAEVQLMWETAPPRMPIPGPISAET
jgi:hypothetical protein